jgi:serine/threonine protein kinase
MHNKFYIHRDVKPENFMNGRKEYKDVLYLIDFGLCKRYRDPKTGEHVKYTNNRRLNGTARYASIHALEGYESSRRDDLECLCYVLVYFLNGHLPWGRIKNKNKQERYKLILNMKKKINAENLVGDKNNIEFIEFVKYCRKLKFEEKPDYDYLRGLMINCISKNNKSIDNFYNLDVSKNPLFLSQDKLKVANIDFPVKHTPNNLRYNSTKKFKNNLMYKFANENYEDKEEYDNQIINESISSSLGYIEKKVRNYSSYKKRGIEEIQRIIEKKKKKEDNQINLRIINKIQTSFRNPSDIKVASYDKKKSYGRSRFEFIKKSLGIQKTNDIINSDSNGKFPIKNSIGELNENNSINNNNNNNEPNKDDGCIIL